MRKCLVIVPFPLDDDGIANRKLQLNSVKIGPDINFEFRPVLASSSSFMSDHDWFLMEAGCFEAGLSAQDEGYDAVVIDATSDSAASALRSVLDIPVIAPGQTSMLYALMLGSSFGILAMNKAGCFSHQQWADQRNLSQFLAAVEPISGSNTDISKLLTGQEEEMFPLMKIAAEKAISKGADVILLGSTTMHQAGNWLNENLSVPVVNPGPLTYKIVETILSLGHTHSRKSFPSPEVNKAGMIHAMMTAAANYEKNKK
ncbi:aspartate/glutamate racemase family protein [Alphaproteobacteria bacterium]|nr:aspartate/glutamate racemase family protein [Alphaproteobacteria bacterium]